MTGEDRELEGAEDFAERGVQPVATPAYFALEFEDGIAAADFAAALVDFLGSDEGRSYSAGPGAAEVWITSPLGRGHGGMHCCIYANESAARAAQVAGLGVRHAERVDSASLPRQRIRIIGDAPGDTSE